MSSDVAGPHVGDIELVKPPSGVKLSAPTGIIASPDGDVWFTSIADHRLGRVKLPVGRIEVFADPADKIRLRANIYPGPDGWLWFTSLGSNRIGRIDSAADDPAQSIERSRRTD